MVATTAEATPARFRLRTILLPLIAIIIAAFMIMLDSTAINIAIPGLVANMHAKLTTLQWTITGYALAEAMVIPLAGWLSDRYGAKRMLLGSLALFIAGSALCAAAPAAGILILFRVLQGLGGGMVLPIALAFTYRLSPPEKVGTIIGLMGVPILFAPAVGPIVAGWLVQYASWRWIFMINLPIGIVGLLLGLRGLPALGREQATGGALDLPGLILGPLAFASLAYGVSQGSTSWTAASTLAGLIGGAAALVAFIIFELRASTPLLELRVFRSINFTTGILVQWTAKLALVGPLFLIPLFLEQVRGYGAFETGLILVPEAIAAAILMPLAGMLFDRIGARPLVLTGLVLMAVGVDLLAHLSMSTTGLDLILPLALLGAGEGMMVMTLNTYLMNASPRHLIGRVTSLTSALGTVIGSMVVAGLATILTTQTRTQVTAAKVAYAVHHRLPAGATHQSTVQAPHALSLAVGSASAVAFNNTIELIIVAAVCAAVLALALRPPRRRSIEAVDSATETEEIRSTISSAPPAVAVGD